MSCRKQRKEATRVVGNTTKTVDEDDGDEDRWTEDDDEEIDGGSWQSYKKNEWKLVAV